MKNDFSKYLLKLKEYMKKKLEYKDNKLQIYDIFL